MEGPTATFCVGVSRKPFTNTQTGTSQFWALEAHTGQPSPPSSFSPFSLFSPPPLSPFSLSISQHIHIHVYMYNVHDCLGCAVLLCLVVCLTLLASFFLPSFSSLIKTCTCRSLGSRGRHNGGSLHCEGEGEHYGGVRCPCQNTRLREE